MPVCIHRASSVFSEPSAPPATTAARPKLTGGAAIAELHAAAARGDAATLKHLVTDGTPVDSTANGATALMAAALNGHAPCVEELVAGGASTEVANAEGLTALGFAAAGSHAPCVSALLRARARTDARRKDGLTPLMLAAGKGGAECVELLLEAGAQMDVPKKDDGFTALMLAAISGHAECAAFPALAPPPSPEPSA